ncbi:MAG: O-antigen ligase family protein [Anaerolineales bacterium]
MGFDTTTLVLLLILGPIVFVLGWLRPFWVLSTLVLILPFRDLSIRMLNAFTDIPIETVNSLSRWWFVTVLALLAVWVVKGVRRFLDCRRIPKPEILDIILGVLVVMGVIEAFLSPNLLAGITSLRGYLQPLIVFVLARAFLPRDERDLRVMHIALLVVGGLLFTMALWQLTSWTEETYRAWGYVDQIGRITGLFRDYGHIGVAFIRPASTVSGPNELGVLFLIFFYLALQWQLFGVKKVRLVMFLLSIAFLVGLAMTNSRAAFVGLITSAVLLLIYLIRIYGAHLRTIDRRKWLLLLTAVLIGLSVFTVVMVSSGMMNMVVWTIQNLDMEDHIVRSQWALQNIIQSPSGVGMGMVWPKGAALLMETEPLYHIEGSLFQIAFEWGLWGFAVWMAFVGIALARVWKAWVKTSSFQVQVHSGTAFLGWVGALVAFIFLPLMQSINLMVLLWFLLGMGVGLAQVEGPQALDGFADPGEVVKEEV